MPRPAVLLFSRSVLPALSILSLCGADLPAASPRWLGTNSVFWSEEQNWNPPVTPPFNGRHAASILVNGTSELVYDSSLGDTIYGTASEPGFRIGAGGTGESGALVITGGRFSSAGSPSIPDEIGPEGGSLVVRGGLYESGPAGLTVGAADGKPARFELHGGLARVPQLKLHLPAGSLVVSGGLLDTRRIVIAGSAPGSAGAPPIRLGGGVIRTTGDIPSLFTVPAGLEDVVEIDTGGATFDVGPGKVVVREGLRSARDLDPSTPDGGLVKEGDGDLFLIAPSAFNGDITVNRGVLRATKGGNILNPAKTALGTTRRPGRTIFVNDGGVLCLGTNDVFGSLKSEVKTTITVSAGGLLTNQYRQFNHAFGFVNRLGPLQLNGGTVHTEGGANERYQSFGFGGPVLVGGKSPSRITASTHPQARHLGYHLETATVFDVADVTRSTEPDLLVEAPLLNRAPVAMVNIPPGGLIKEGAGTLRLSAANPYFGATEVRDGSLALDHPLALQFTAVELRHPGRVELLGQSRAYRFGGLKHRGEGSTEIMARGNRVVLAPEATSEFNLRPAAQSTAPLRISGGEVTLDGRLVVKINARLPAGRHTFPLLAAPALSGAFRSLVVTGAYEAEGPGDASATDGAGNRFTFDPAQGAMDVEIR